MRVVETAIPGCYELLPAVRSDARGSFAKTFEEEIYARHGLATRFAEEYHTRSHRNVLRGLHFQIPPMDHAKVVTCLEGTVLDAVVDLRRGSPSAGTHVTFELSAERANTVYMPAGMAHGFCVTSRDAVLLYRVTTPYSEAHDAGVLWSSAGIPWPVADPILSDRDRGFPGLPDFDSPFVF